MKVFGNHNGQRIAYLMVLAITSLATNTPTASAQRGANPISREASDETFSARLNQLADEAAANELPQLSSQIRDWFIPRFTDRQYVFLPPPAVKKSDTADLSAAERQVREKWMKVRGEQADRLSKLADRALVNGNAEAAVQLLHEVIRERPDDRRARRALGLGNKSGPTSTIGSPPKLSRSAQTAFGWPAGGYWRMQTDHFLITTNHSAEAAEELAVILEEFYSVWQQLFVSYWTTPASVRQSMKGRGLSRRSGAKHNVVLFKNREEYVDHLKRIEPQAAMTLGIYRDTERAAYFFAGDEKLHSTWRHEVAHQLFYESLRRGKRVGEEQNFWLVEGVALYLESLRRVETCGTDETGTPCNSVYYTVGGFDAERLQFARYRALNEQFYVPSEQLSEMGRIELQQDPRIRRLYSQSAGLAHFLLDGEQARYRAATLQLLRQIYNSTDKPDSLSKLAKSAPSEIDAAYRRFLVVDDDQLAALRKSPNIRKLCLGKSTLTDSALEGLSELKSLDWLDLADCEISDVGIRYLSPHLPLSQLNLEGTNITDAGLEHISQWESLTELDLSQTAVTDAALSQIAKLKRLKVLWLTGTKVSDAGIRQLSGMKHLETLDVSHTEVTRDAWERLKKDLPQLNTSAQN